jgi:hypothetical protein
MNISSVAKQVFQFTIVGILTVLISLPPNIQPNLQAAPLNLLANPGFETVTAGNPAAWTKVATGTIDSYFEVSSDDKKSGTRSGYLEAGTGTGEVYWLPQYVPAGANQSHTFSFWYVSSVPFTIKALSRNTSGVVTTTTLGTTTASANTWKQATVTFVTPAGTSQLSVITSISRIGWAHIDDISLVSNATTTTPPTTGTGSGGTTTPPTNTGGTTPPTTGSGTGGTTTTPPTTPPASATNMISNPSAETVQGGAVTNWQQVKWGVNTATFSTPADAQSGSRSMQINVSSYTSGDLRWAHSDVNVTPNTEYSFSAFYKSNKPTILLVESTLLNNTKEYRYLATLDPSATWKQTTAKFTSSAQAKSMNVYIAINSVGFIQTDNYILAPTTTPPTTGTGTGGTTTTPPNTTPVQTGPPTQLQREGRWRQLGSTSVVGIHSITLPGGKTMLFDGTEGAGNGDERNLIYETFDINSKTASRFTAKNTIGDLIKYAAFCAGIATLPGGDVFFAGGDTNGDAYGSDKAALYNAVTNTWKMVAKMNNLRWYPSAIQTLSNEFLVVGGTTQTYDTPATIPEIYNSTTNSWRNLVGAEDLNDPQTGGTNHFYPWLFNLPDGKVANLGPKPTISLIDLSGNGALQNYAYRDQFDGDTILTARSQIYGSVARINQNEVLVVGGGSDPVGPAQNLPVGTRYDQSVGPSRQANIIDLTKLTGQSPVGGVRDYDFIRETAWPSKGRVNAALVITANGDVMLTGGSNTVESGRRNEQYDNAVLVPEVWSYANKTWSPVAAHSTKRIYHMTAMLQKDGTILQAGGAGFNGQCTLPRGGEDVTVKGANACKEVEIYEPGYLFDQNGAYKNRPNITSTAQVQRAGSTFGITATSPIAKVTMVRAGVMTHGTNIEQYNLIPQVALNGAQAQITLPAGNYATPKGNYFLYVWDASGTPSIAQEITVN